MKNDKFEQYFLQYKNLVIRLVMSKIGDYHAAQDICQQVYVSLYENMDHISPDLVKAWLIRCTQNAIIDYYRRSTREKDLFSGTSVEESGNVLVNRNVDALEEKIDHLELAGKVLNAVRAANYQWYEVLLMRCVEGLSTAEAAQKLGISETVFRARLYRARVFVRERFEDEYHDHCK